MVAKIRHHPKIATNAVKMNLSDKSSHNSALNSKTSASDFKFV